MDNPQSINPELFGVEEITNKMQLDASKITKNPNALLMQTRHENSMLLLMRCLNHFKYEMEIDSWGGPMNPP